MLFLVLFFPLVFSGRFDSRLHLRNDFGSPRSIQRRQAVDERQASTAIDGEKEHAREDLIKNVKK